MYSHSYDAPVLQRDVEAWSACFRSIAIRPGPQDAGRDFVGWARRFNGCGFEAVDLGCNLLGMGERTRRDVRADGMDDFMIVIQIGGSATMIQNDDIAQMAAGEVVLHDMSRPIVIHYQGEGHWFGLQLPRRRLISHLGFEPVGGLRAQGSLRAARLLHEVALSALHGEDGSSSPADAYLQLAVYGVIGALFTQEAWPLLRPSDKLFHRLSRIIDNNFTDPDFGPRELAEEAGISLRYVHKLFGERGEACTASIYARRLDHAAQLLRRRSSLATGQPLSEISQACGFRNQTVFGRKFHRRFGAAPRDYNTPPRSA